MNTKNATTKDTPLAVMIMDFEPDVLLRDLARQYAAGKMSLTEFTMVFADTVNAAIQQKVEFKNV
jgi:hypothetical protein